MKGESSSAVRVEWNEERGARVQTVVGETNANLLLYFLTEDDVSARQLLFKLSEAAWHRQGREGSASLPDFVRMSKSFNLDMCSQFFECSLAAHQKMSRRSTIRPHNDKSSRCISWVSTFGFLHSTFI